MSHSLLEQRYNKHSVLERHSVHLPDKQHTSISFYSYYNYDSPIYYEIRALIKVFKFTNEAATIASIPNNWVRTVESFQDLKFHNKFDNDTLFVEAAGIAYLISICENRTLITTVTNLYNICIRKTENDRVRRLNARIQKLSGDLKELLGEVNEMRQEHDTHKKEITTKHSFISTTLESLANNHVAIQNLLDALVNKLK